MYNNPYQDALLAHANDKAGPAGLADLSDMPVRKTTKNQATPHRPSAMQTLRRSRNMFWLYTNDPSMGPQTRFWFAINL